MKQLTLKNVALSTSLIVPILIAFILSFRAFSLQFTPDFDSDQAVHVLMAYDLKLPHDFYYWGQSRIGSLLPIVSHVLLAFLPISPIEAVSDVHYFFLAIGYFCFISLFKRNIIKVVFALIWFLPPAPFMGFVQPVQPYGIGVSFIGISIVLIKNLMEKPEKSLVKRRFLTAGAVSSLFISFWVCDFSLVSIVLLIVLLRHHFFQDKLAAPPKGLKGKKLTLESRWVLLVSSFWIAFIIYAKLTADAAGGLYGIRLISVLRMIETVFVSTLKAILFQVGNPLLSLYSILFAIILVVFTISIFYNQKNKGITDSFWILFFAFNALVCFGILFLSHWVYINQAGSRYFSVSYIFCWLAILLYFDQLAYAKTKKILALIVIASLVGSTSLPSYVFALEKPTSRLSVLQQTEALGKAGFIGDYWTAYKICSADPKLLSCTPHDKQYVRCKRCVSNVFQSPVIYLVKEGWLDTLPPKINQFGRQLVKQGADRTVAGYTLAPYQLSAK